MWHLVDESRVDVTLIKDNEEPWEIIGQSHFLTDFELKEIEKYIPSIQQIFRKLIKEGKTLLLEWSFTYDSNLIGEAIGNPYLVFYEMRTIESK
ncbi:hypothetical protein AZF37_01585 [endosymbiont 'TC1' of Trimyema compressum]|uniref:hypothetical protein n=1 Tax=endosymbiont 'TC1' of Trimyema compressum TaxID=243899 RepID=UPI0007F14807|nr:hypothetical protein [endosymbiont 'TC1' of Trimyema compressum]AMP20039.1 hypothetical protein AZF37_01585 [endosymbiont 'TC1' of Trimyema compressum]